MSRELSSAGGEKLAKRAREVYLVCECFCAGQRQVHVLGVEWAEQVLAHC